MKLYYSIFLLILSTQIYAQDPLLFEHAWELEKIVTEEETFTATPYPVPQDGSMEYIDFMESDEFQNHNFIFGYYGNAVAEDMSFSATENTFEILSFSGHFGGSSPAESFFRDNFIYLDYMSGSYYNPYTYNFRDEEEKIYLDITNGEGTVATFWVSTMSANSFEEIEFSFYPNPAKDHLHIESPQSEIQKFEIFDMNGKQVLQSDLVGQETIDVSNLKSGVYLLQVLTKEGKATRKLVKE